VQLHLSTDRAVLDRLADTLGDVVADVRQVVDDRGAIEQAQGALADELDRLAAAGGAPFSATDLTDTAALLRWLAGGYFTVLGYARYRLHTVGGRTVSDLVDDTSLGVLRPGVGTD